MQITVAGAVQKVRPGGFEIEDRLEERSICRLTIDDGDGSRTFHKGHPVTVVDDAAATIFAGVVDDIPNVEPQTPSAAKFHELVCVDWHYLADKRRIARAYEEQTCGSIATDLITRVLGAEGITAGTINAGPVLSRIVFDYKNCATALDELAEHAGFTWWIDVDKALHFVPRTANTAPWTITPDDIIRPEHGGQAGAGEGNAEYRNTQWIRGGRDVTDQQVETRIGDGNTRAWVMAFDLAKEPTVTLNANPQTVGIRGLEEGFDWYWNKGLPEISQDPDGVVLEAADTLQVTYVGEYQIIAKAEDPVAIADRLAIEGVGTGIVENVADEPVDSRAAAFESARAKLEKYAVIGRTLEFITKRSGLRPGQLATVDAPDEYGLDGVEMLVTSVETFAFSTQIRYRVTCVEGLVVGSWRKFFGALIAAAGERIELTNVGGGDIVALLATNTESWAWTETLETRPIVCVTLETAWDFDPAADGEMVLC